MDVTTKIIKQDDSKTLLLIYSSPALSVYEVGQEIGFILTALIGLIDSGWNCDDLSVAVEDSSGKPLGYWYCLKEWKEAHVRGDMSKEELVANIVSTFKRVQS